MYQRMCWGNHRRNFFGSRFGTWLRRWVHQLDCPAYAYQLVLYMQQREAVAARTDGDVAGYWAWIHLEAFNWRQKREAKAYAESRGVDWPLVGWRWKERLAND